MLNLLKEFFEDKKILILGFGVEGQSTYNLLRRIFPDRILNIADVNESLVNNKLIENDILKINLQLGGDYLNDIDNYDLVIKSPGISLKNISGIDYSKFTSHTELFTRIFKKQIIGITGTKGKSTTSSLVHHIIKTYNNNCLLVGNIGVPPFDLIDDINKDTVIVYELSSHQLEQIRVSPHIAVLLNLYEEHLDHYKSFEKYQLAKLNIAIHQENDDYFIFNADDKRITDLVSVNELKGILHRFSLSEKIKNGCYVDNGKIIFCNQEVTTLLEKTTFSNLIGDHNLQNIMAAACASLLAGIPATHISQAVDSFQPLEHRIEFVGKYNDILYYNDSISTIPEATIAALTSLKTVDTLLLGGFDRGISYNYLMEFLSKSAVRNLIFIGDAGRRMLDIYEKENYSGKNIFFTKDFTEAVNHAKRSTQKNMICLLSPAAASYDMFRDFKERGEVYKKIVRS